MEYFQNKSAQQYGSQNGKEDYSPL
jgi:hypothetical protein